MPFNFTNKSRHLSVVSGTAAAEQAAIISAEDLTLAQREIIDQYRQISDACGVLVGALTGGADWDLRPLTVENGVLSISRFSDPILACDVRKFDYLRSIYERLGNQPGLCAMEACGSLQGRLWVRRQFYGDVLGTRQQTSPAPGSPAYAFARLLETLEQLHRLGVVHGHLCPSNVTFTNDLPGVMDTAFCVFSRIHGRNIRDLAPELAAGAAANPATDVYGLGLIARSLFVETLGHEQRALIQHMLAVEPAARPGLSEVERLFTAVSDAIPGSLAGGPLAGAGRLLDDQRGGAQPSLTGRLLADNPVPPPPAAVEAAALPAAAAGSQDRAMLRLVLYLMLAAVLALAGQRYWPLLAERFGLGQSSDSEYQALWSSGQPSLMLKVAEEALDDNRSAQNAIVGAALRGAGAKAQVRNDMLRAAFNPLWEGQLSADDRRFVLALALSQLVTYAGRPLPPLSAVHPGVLLAMAAFYDLEQPAGEFSGIDLERLAGLPGYYGEAFRRLAALGVPDLADNSARAISHLLAGSLTPGAAELFFAADDSAETVAAKLALVCGFLKERSGLDSLVYGVLLGRYPLTTQLLGWFQLENVAGWESAPDAVKLTVMSGVLPPQELRFKQYADLLQFPVESVRRAAVARIIPKLLPETVRPVLNYLGGAESRLTRVQGASLLAALRLDREMQYSFLSKWFAAGPDPQAVLDLLLLRSSIDALDPFNVEAARYLTKEQFPLELEKLKLLAAHPEILARSLAYSRLRTDRPEEVELLRDAAKVEPNQRIRRELELRLKDAKPAADKDTGKADKKVENRAGKKSGKNAAPQPAAN